MSSTSTRFGMKVPDGTDPFDNDLYLKGNLNIIDKDAAKLLETLFITGGLKAEIVEVSIPSSGSQNTLTSSLATYKNKYTSTPVVFAGTVTQSVSYVDTINEPFVNATTSGFTVKLKVAYNGVAFENFGSGTIKMKFLVVGT